MSCCIAGGENEGHVNDQCGSEPMDQLVPVVPFKCRQAMGIKQLQTIDELGAQYSSR